MIEPRLGWTQCAVQNQIQRLWTSDSWSSDHVDNQEFGYGPVRCGLETAKLDLLARLHEESVAGLLELRLPTTMKSAVTAGCDSKFEVRPLGGRGPSILKLKIGQSDPNSSPIQAARDVDKFLSNAWEVCGVEEIRADANCHYSAAQWRLVAATLRDHGVLVVEEPVRLTEEWRDARLTAERFEIKILADEMTEFLSIDTLTERYHGAVLKTQSLGGLLSARTIAQDLRARGLLVYLGCFAETKLGNAASYQLSALSDGVDLESHILFDEVGRSGFAIEHDGRVTLGSQIGHGVTNSARVSRSSL